MMVKGFFLIVGLSTFGANAMNQESALIISPRTNIQYMRLAQTMSVKIFELKDELNRNKAGHLFLSPHNMLSPEIYQTKTGIFLECEYGLPRALHLPYGRWQIVNQIFVQGGYDKKFIEKLIPEFALELVQEKPRVVQSIKKGMSLMTGSLILIYAVGRIGQTALEKASYKDQTEYMDDKHARTAWKALITE